MFKMHRSLLGNANRWSLMYCTVDDDVETGWRFVVLHPSVGSEDTVPFSAF